jgi:hypothetical protein
MTDIVERLRSIYKLRGDTYSSMEVFGAVNQAAAEIERLRAVAQARSHELRAAGADVITELRDEIERLRAACERMMIGGNHIALYKTDRWPDPGTDCLVALETLHAGREYDMWCCWNAIMCARRALEDKL